MTSSHDLSFCVIPTLVCLLFQTSKPTVENDFETKKLRECLVHLQDLAKDNQENIGSAGRRNCDDNQLLSEDSNAKQSGKIIAFYCTDYPDDESLF